LDYAFKKLKLHRVGLDVYAYNPRAISVYKKLGFKSEGRGREYLFQNGRWHDEIWMSILDREWLKRK